MEKFFSMFGKFMLMAVFVGALAGGGYYLGRSGKVQVSVPQETGALTTTNPTIAVSPTPTQTSTKTVTAGLGTDSGLSFTKYSLEIPNGWAPVHTSTNEGTLVDTLTITQGAYTLKIFQAATGGAICVYPGDPVFEGPSSNYDVFVELTTKDGVLLRRGGTKGAYTVCQKGSESFGQPTGFGHMSLTTPVAPEQTVLQEMDTMIQSLKKI